jgi:hypothetical protein
VARAAAHGFVRRGAHAPRDADAISTTANSMLHASTKDGTLGTSRARDTRIHGGELSDERSSNAAVVHIINAQWMLLVR